MSHFTDKETTVPIVPDPEVEIHERTGDDTKLIAQYLHNHLDELREGDADFIDEKDEFVVPNSPIADAADVISVNPTLEKYQKLTQAYKTAISSKIVDFFSHGDIDELIRGANELETNEFGFELVKRIINMSFDRTDRERELVSRFLSVANFENVLDSTMIEKGFLRLFECIYVDGIEMDVPGAQEMLTKFLARAVVDEIISPRFLMDEENIELGKDVITHAKALLSRELAPVVLETCWGPGDGRSVSALKKSIDMLVKEYLLSSDLDEATRCVRELQSPHFLHELLKRSVTMSLDESAEAQVKISSFLHHLSINDILTKGQAAQGFDRLFARINDLKLDSPAAPRILEEFVERAKADGVLLPSYVPNTAVVALIDDKVDDEDIY